MAVQPSPLVVTLYKDGVPQPEAFQGFYLSGDFCSEHEGGIVSLHNVFDVEGHPGIFHQKVSDVTERNLRFYELEDASYLLGGELCGDPRVDEPSSYGIPIADCGGVRGGWRSNTFLISCAGEPARTNLKNLYEAFLRCDGAIYVGPAMSLVKTERTNRGGLYVCIYSAVNNLEDGLPNEGEDDTVIWYKSHLS